MKKFRRKIRSLYKKDVTTYDIIAKIFYYGMWIVLVIYALSMLIIPIYMIITALKADDLEYVKNPFGLPETATWSNFKEILQVFSERMDVSIGSMIGVSLATSIFKPLLGVFFTTVFAYVEAYYNFFGKKFLFNLGIVVMVLPIVGNLPSAMQVSKALGVYDNLILNILTSPVGCFYGTNFLLMYATFKGIPWAYAESAMIDGASHYKIFFKIYLPMALPQAVVLFVLGFMTTWNDYSTYLIWLPSTPNISYGMYLFYQRATSYRVTLPQLMSGFIIVMVPTVILYLSTQKIIRSKFIVGGLKG